MSKSNCTGTERKIVAWARKWHVEDEAEKKVRSPETGRMVILPKFHYLRVTAHKLFDDDIPLYASDSWQPIETAPRDGTPVLLFVMGHDLWVGAVYDSDMSDTQSRRPPATHWLPLPVDRPGRIQESNVKDLTSRLRTESGVAMEPQAEHVRPPTVSRSVGRLVRQGSKP